MGYCADLRTLGEKKIESKGGGKWNTGVVIRAGEACNGCGVAGDRQRQLLVQLEVHWCSRRRSLENVCLGILLHTGLLSSQKIHRDVSHVSKLRILRHSTAATRDQ